jgi:hypothetical protein
MEFNLKICFLGVAARERSKPSHYGLFSSSQAVFFQGASNFSEL